MWLVPGARGADRGVSLLPVAELGSDEDDIDEEGQEYLEMLAKQAGEDGEDEDWEEDDAEETALEGYTTAVDDEDNLVDEYQIFKTILQSKDCRASLTIRVGPIARVAYRGD